MKRLNDTEYIHVDSKTNKVRMFHDCNNYKGGKRGMWRVELVKMDSKDEKYLFFKCPHCNKERTIERGLVEALNKSISAPAPVKERSKQEKYNWKFWKRN